MFDHLAVMIVAVGHSVARVRGVEVLHQGVSPRSSSLRRPDAGFACLLFDPLAEISLDKLLYTGAAG